MPRQAKACSVHFQDKLHFQRSPCGPKRRPFPTHASLVFSFKTEPPLRLRSGGKNALRSITPSTSKSSALERSMLCMDHNEMTRARPLSVSIANITLSNSQRASLHLLPALPRFPRGLAARPPLGAPMGGGCEEGRRGAGVALSDFREGGQLQGQQTPCDVRVRAASAVLRSCCSPEGLFFEAQDKGLAGILLTAILFGEWIVLS